MINDLHNPSRHYLGTPSERAAVDWLAEYGRAGFADSIAALVESFRLIRDSSPDADYALADVNVALRETYRQAARLAIN